MAQTVLPRQKNKISRTLLCCFLITGAWIGVAATEDSAPTQLMPKSQHHFPDPELAGQWWETAMQLSDAWKLATGKNVIIASCDAGLYLEASDLAKNILDEDRYDFSDVDHPRKVNDGRYVSLGTAAAAIMVGVKDGKGTNGIAFDSKLVPLQNFNYDDSLDDTNKEEATANCILRAIRIPAVRIIFVANQTRRGSFEADSKTRFAVSTAVRAGITVVGTAGDSSTELKIEQREDSGSVIVGALLRNGKAALFSNYGSRVSIGGFGEKIKTLHGRRGQMHYFAGTAAAAAQVAGAIALMLEIQPDLLPYQIRNILKSTRSCSSFNKQVGCRIKVISALEQARLSKIDHDGVQTARRFLEELRNSQLDYFL